MENLYDEGEQQYVMLTKPNTTTGKISAAFIELVRSHAETLNSKIVHNRDSRFG